MQYREHLTESGSVQDGWVIVERVPVITSLDVIDAVARPSQYGGGAYEIDFQINPEGALRLSEATGKHVGENLAIVFHDEVKSAPRILGQITDRAQITGNFTKEPAQDLALVLRSGTLPLSWKLTYTSEETFSTSRWIRKYQITAVVSTLTCLALLAILYLVNRRRGVC